MSTEPDAGETANDDEAPTAEQTETVEVELPPADIERIELEIEQNSDASHASETVEEWIAKRVHLAFARIDTDAEYHTASPEVDVPPLVAERARLEYESARQRGKDPDLDEILFNTMMIDPEWYVDGEALGTDVAED
ncbi:hypothetical protein [Halococcus agarilyticus]|uniref:hypothetical protein n=1 Tax=Halococcus agarilyticus TaxID=1232219 RepID=UPI00067812B8|nr:hypothetical protein [Halococcus agarilyticus]